MKKFNLRVYGLLKYNQKVLVAHESFKDLTFYKFPGGGVEWGEGIEDTLVREFQEELSMEVEVGDLFYVNRDFLPSKFFRQDQIVVFYFWVTPVHQIPDAYLAPEFTANEHDITFYWVKMDTNFPQLFTLPKDIKVAHQLLTFQE